MESLKELNQICQKPHYKEKGNWMVRRILRDAALPMTWLLLHTRVTAHQVTAFSLVIGLWGNLFLASASQGPFLFGALLLQFWYYLDHVDGQIARYRKTASLTGRFFDFLTHHLIHGTVFFCLGVHAFRVTGQFFWVFWGFAGSISMMTFNLIHDTQAKTFLEALLQQGNFAIQREEEERRKEGGAAKAKFPAAAFLHKLCEMHVLMNLLTFFAFIETMGHVPLDFRVLLLAFYGLAVPALTGAKVFDLIHSGKVDAEFDRRFRKI